MKTTLKDYERLAQIRDDAHAQLEATRAILRLTPEFQNCCRAFAEYAQAQDEAYHAKIGLPRHLAEQVHAREKASREGEQIANDVADDPKRASNAMMSAGYLPTRGGAA